MEHLRLEKQEQIDGVVTYCIFLGNICQFISKEEGNMAKKCTDGRSVALTNAQARYDEFEARIKQGYPKTTILSEIKYK